MVVLLWLNLLPVEFSLHPLHSIAWKTFSAALQNSGGMHEVIVNDPWLYIVCEPLLRCSISVHHVQDQCFPIIFMYSCLCSFCNFSFLSYYKFSRMAVRVETSFLPLQWIGNLITEWQFVPRTHEVPPQLGTTVQDVVENLYPQH